MARANPAHRAPLSWPVRVGRASGRYIPDGNPLVVGGGGLVGAAVLLGLVSVVAPVRSRCIKRERASTVRHRPLNTSSGQRAELLKLRQELRAGSPRSRSDERRRPGLDDSTASAS